MSKANLDILEWLLHELEASFKRDSGDNAICPYCTGKNRFMYNPADHDAFCKYRIAVEHFYKEKGKALVDAEGEGEMTSRIFEYVKKPDDTIDCVRKDNNNLVGTTKKTVGSWRFRSLDPRGLSESDCNALARKLGRLNENA